MRFPLRREQPSQAVCCDKSYGHVFGCYNALRFFSASHWTNLFGQTYDFDTNLAPGIDAGFFLTGQAKLTLAEIEVFETGSKHVLSQIVVHQLCSRNCELTLSILE
jgi:hypothetical protein